jgi:histone acetyltransferase (RNA polymerase elongator complex component)
LKARDFGFHSQREVAFYGGTFTSLGIKKIKELLGAVRPYLDKGCFSSIRVSTRPDKIDGNILELMRKYQVSTVELGVQSMDDEVLRLSKRGHTSSDTVASVKLLKQHGFKVGAQLMPGLPGDSEETFQSTIKKVIELQPDMARLYPAIVINGTGLAELYNNGKYQPLTLEKAISICAESCISLERMGIPVIRIGLMASPSLLMKGQISAGPWHSAFGFLVRSDIHLKSITPLLPRSGWGSKIGIRAPRREIPLIRGYKNQGFHFIEKRTGARVVYIKPDDSVQDGKIEVDIISGTNVQFIQ